MIPSIVLHLLKAPQAWGALCFGIPLAIMGIMMAGVSNTLAQDRPPPSRRMGPPAQDDGPFNDAIYGAISDDGFTFEELPGPFFRHASVPDVVELAHDGPAGRAGTLLVYFVDFSHAPSPGAEGLLVATSQDGLYWSDPESVMIRQKADRGAGR